MIDLEGWKLRGSVRTLRRDTAEWDSALGQWQPPRHLTVVTFRPDGRLVENEQHNPDGSVVRQIRLYDEGGPLTQELWWKDDVLTSRTRHDHDAEGRPLSVIEVRADGTERELERCHYDDQGRKTKVLPLIVPEQASASCSPDGCGPAVVFGVEGSDTAYGAPGATTSTTTYDGRGLPIEASFRDADGVLVRRVVFTRDADGRPLREVVELGGSSSVFGERMALDSVPPADLAGLDELLAAVFAERTFASTGFTYDGYGRLIERIRSFERLSEERTTFQYDDRDNPVEEIVEHQSRELGLDAGVVATRAERRHVEYTRFEYQYDSRGNWTERIAYHRTDIQPEYHRSNIERRTITYFEE